MPIGCSGVMRKGSFGNTNPVAVFWTMSIGKQQPKIKIHVNNKPFQGLIDTGSDIIIIAEREWP